MILIRIYDKSFNELTAYPVGTYVNLSYKSTLGEIADCSFTLNLDNDNVTQTNLEHRNFVAIEDNGTTKWLGVIMDKAIGLNTVNVKCKEMGQKLQDRLTSATFSSIAFDTILSTLLTTWNGIFNTGFTDIVTDITAPVSIAFSQTDGWEAIRQLAERVGAQVKIGTDRKLYVMNDLGNDLTDSVEFRYNVNEDKLATITQFNVGDSGLSIVTKTFGKSNALGGSAQDAALTTRFGLVEKFKSFPQATQQADLDALIAQNNTGEAFSPALTVKPNMTDNFFVGDYVKVKIKNKLLDFNLNYQIVEKSVNILSSKEKSITIRVNTLKADFFKDFIDFNQRIKALETA